MSNLSTAFSEEKTDTASQKNKIVFVCTGNTCRSPMAAALYNHLFQSGTFTATSAGLYADGSPISAKASDALMERGVLPTPDNDYIHHLSRPLDGDIMKDAHLVVAITGAHAMEIMLRYPAYASKVAAMSEDVPDPYGGDANVYRACLAKIESILTASFCRDESEDKGRE